MLLKKMMTLQNVTPTMMQAPENNSINFKKKSMQHIKTFISIVFSASLLMACSGITPSRQASSGNMSKQIIDTGKLKSDINNLVESFTSGKPDTNKLKAVGADILSTTATVLSDTGISNMYGNSNDPAVNTAKNILIKMRNATGITPAALDSIRKAAATLQGNAQPDH
jgi:hypothetical protein